MLRWTVLGVTVIASVCGFSVVLGLLDPYSAYGRIVVHIFKPVYMLGNNLLESVFSRFDNYTFYQVDTSVLSLSSPSYSDTDLCRHSYISMETWTHVV